MAETQINSQNRNLLRQTLLVWFVTMAAIRIFHEFQRIAFFKEYIMLLTALSLIYVPAWTLWRKKERIEFFETSWAQLAKSLGWFFVVSLAIFPVIEFGNRYFQDIFFHRRYLGGHYQGILNTATFHVLLVALPEEFFFRGYMQYQLDRFFGKPWNFLGTQVGWSLPLTSLIFAFSHSLIHQQWWHFSIFFPALVFGWLREKTGAITASVLFHALCNVYSFWVLSNYKY